VSEQAREWEYCTGSESIVQARKWEYYCKLEYYIGRERTLQFVGVLHRKREYCTVSGSTVSEVEILYNMLEYLSGSGSTVQAKEWQHCRVSGSTT
jgi:hypothetical protein